MKMQHRCQIKQKNNCIKYNQCFCIDSVLQKTLNKDNNIVKNNLIILMKISKGAKLFSNINQMVLSKHVKHYRRGISLSRRLSEDATRGNDVEIVKNVSEKLSSSSSGIIKKNKTIMQNHWKNILQFKNNIKFDYNKNLQWILNKYWMEAIQKLSNSSLNNTREFSNGKNIDEQVPIKKIEDEKIGTLTKSVKVQLPSNEPGSKVEPEAAQLMQSTKDQLLALSQVLSDFFVKFNTKSKEPTSVAPIPKWKTNVRHNVTRDSIISRTKHVLYSIVTAESDSSKLKRIDDLLVHIDQYPEARNFAIKEGAVRVLLRARQKFSNSQIDGSIREGLALLGHIDPVPRRGIRILSIDGGGMRGLLVIEMLKKLEELTGQRVHEMFDYICGVSTGAILSANLGSDKRKSLEEVSELYKEISSRVFDQGAIRGTSSLVWSHAYYDTALWEKLLQEQLGCDDLIKTTRDPHSPKFSAISTISNNTQVSAYIFRNYTLPPRVESQYMGSHKHKLWEAARASAAAPTYFEEFKHGEFILSDGGIMVNNPCAVAIHEAKQLWPNTPIQCVISFGTGRIPPSLPNSQGQDLSALSWKDKFYQILASATDTEGVHIMLNDLLPNNYFRFNPYLTEMISMDDIRPEKWEQLELDAQMYIRRNEEKFIHAAKALNQKKKVSQKVIDWVKLQKKLMGF